MNNILYQMHQDKDKIINSKTLNKTDKIIIFNNFQIYYEKCEKQNSWIQTRKHTIKEHKQILESLKDIYKKEYYYIHLKKHKLTEAEFYIQLLQYYILCFQRMNDAILHLETNQKKG